MTKRSYPEPEPQREQKFPILEGMAAKSADVDLETLLLPGDSSAQSLAKLDSGLDVVSQEETLAAMAPPGRKWGKCTPELTARMVKLVKAGNFPDTAAVACGLSLHSYYQWRQRGQAGESPYAEWLATMAQACAECEVGLLATIAAGDDKGAGFGPAKAALEIIRNRNPKRWSMQVKIEVSDQLQKYLNIAEQVCPPDVFQTLLERLAESDEDPDG